MPFGDVLRREAGFRAVMLTLDAFHAAFRLIARSSQLTWNDHANSID